MKPFMCLCGYIFPAYCQMEEMTKATLLVILNVYVFLFFGL